MVTVMMSTYGTARAVLFHAFEATKRIYMMVSTARFLSSSHKPKIFAHISEAKGITRIFGNCHSHNHHSFILFYNIYAKTNSYTTTL